MGRSRKQQARRAKKRRRTRRTGETHQEPVSAIEMHLEQAYQLYRRYLADQDVDTAAAAARADLRSNAAQMVDLVCGKDLLTVVSALRQHMAMSSAFTGLEPSAAALELLSLVLAHRDLIVEESDSPDSTRFDPAKLEAAARHGLALGGMLALLDTPPTDAESNILFRSIQREILLRNPVYPHMLAQTLRLLFSDAAVNADCRTALGFTAIEALEVMEAVRDLAIAELTRRFDRFWNAADALQPHIDAMPDGPSDNTTTPSDEARAAGEAFMATVQDLTTNIAQATMVDPETIAQHSGHDRSLVEAILDAFTYAATGDLEETLVRFFRGNNPLRTAPIVTDAAGRRMLVHDALVLPAVREVIESKLNEAGLLTRYQHHRGKAIENAAIDLLAGAFPDATVCRGFKYLTPDPDAPIAQDDPGDFTKPAEGDGLILIDDIALIIEVKAVAMTAAARGGVAVKLKDRLRAIVTKAADQASRLRERILADGRIRLVDGQWIEAGDIREIHAIAVGLEDLSGVTTATTALVGAGFLPADNIPWTVSIHDLRIICELVERPSDLLLYLRRRTHPEATWKYRAVDELDLFMHFLSAGLFVVPDPAEVQRELPWAPAPAASTVRRFTEQQPVMITSLTEPLDAWYDTQFDEDAPPVARPRLEADAKLIELVDQILGTGAPGSLATATAMLEGDPQTQRRFGRMATKLGKLVQQDQKGHSATVSISETTGKHILLVWQCQAPGQELEESIDHLTGYLRAKKYQTKSHRAAGLLFNRRGTKLLHLAYDNDPWQPNPDLDQAAASLIPLDQTPPARPIPNRLPGRYRRPG